MLAVSLFISGSEIFIILLVVLLLFGANKLPEIARGLGKGMNEFKRATRDIRSEFDEQTKDIQKDVKELRKDIEDQTRFNLNDDFIDDPDQEQQTGKEDSDEASGKKEKEQTTDETDQRETDQRETEDRQSEDGESEDDAASTDESRPPDDPYGLNKEDRRNSE